MVFVDLFARGGGSTTAAVTLDTVADESMKMTGGVTRSPARLRSRDGKISYYGRLEHDFLLMCLAFDFSYFLLHHPDTYIFVVLRLCGSHLLHSASRYFMVRVVACVICILPQLGIPLFLFVYRYSFFRSFYFSGGVFWCTLVPGALALGLPTLILQQFWFSLSHRL